MFPIFSLRGDSYDRSIRTGDWTQQVADALSGGQGRPRRRRRRNCWAKWKDWGNDGTDTNVALSDVFFLLFALAGTIAVVCAIASLVRHRHLGWTLDRIAGLRVLIDLFVAVIAIAVVSAAF